MGGPCAGIDSVTSAALAVTRPSVTATPSDGVHLDQMVAMADRRLYADTAPHQVAGDGASRGNLAMGAGPYPADVTQSMAQIVHT